MALIAETQKQGTLSPLTTDGVNTTGANLLVVIAHYPTGLGSGDPVMGTDSKGNASWNGLTKYQRASGGSIQIFYHTSPVVGSGHTVTITNGSSTFVNATVSFLAFGAMQGYDSIENGATSVSTEFSAGSVTPNSNGVVIVTGATINTTATASMVTGGFSTVVQTNFDSGSGNHGGAYCYLEQSSIAAVDPIWHFTATVTTAAASAVFIADTGIPLGVLTMTGTGVSMNYTINMPDEL